MRLQLALFLGLLLCVGMFASQSHADTSEDSNEQVYYHASISPSTGLSEGTVLILDGMQIDLRLFIGSSEADHGIPETTLPLKSGKASNDDELVLGVFAVCKVCEEEAVQAKRITYSKGLHTSTEVHFLFIPRQSLVYAPLYKGTILLQLVNDRGIFLETISLSVIVGKE